MKLYHPIKERAKPINITVTKDELQQIAVRRYRHVDTHPVDKFDKGTRRK